MDEQEDIDQIKSGMTANITVRSGSRSGVLVLPSQYLLEEGGQSMVYVASQDGPVTQTVTTGARTNTGLVEITSGLSEGQEVYLIAK